MIRRAFGLSSLVISIVLVAACSSGSSGNGSGVIRPLSVDEKARMKESAKSLGEVTGLANEFASSRTSQPTRPGFGRRQLMAHAAMELLFARQPGSPTHGNASELKQVIDESQCTKTMKFPEDEPPLQAGETEIGVFTYDVSGPGCPLRFHASLSGHQFYDAQKQPVGLKAVLKYQYQAISEEALKAADVDRVDLSGNIEIRSNTDQNGNTNLTFALDFGGTGHSQKDGDFRVSNRADGGMQISIGAGSMSPSAQPPTQPPGGGFPAIDIKGAMNETMLFVFGDLTAQLQSKVAINGFNQTADFRINGAQVSQAEYEEFRKTLNVPGMMDGPGGEPQPTNSLVCESSFFSRSMIDVGTLQDLLDRNQEPTVVPVARYTSCSAFGPRDQMSFTAGQHIFKFDFEYEINRYAKATVEVCSSSNPTNCSRAKRAFMFDEKAAYADAAGEHTVMIRCEPKPSCF